MRRNYGDFEDLISSNHHKRKITKKKKKFSPRELERVHVENQNKTNTEFSIFYAMFTRR